VHLNPNRIFITKDYQIEFILHPCIQGCRRAGTVRSGVPARFVLSVPAFICNGPKASFRISRRKKRDIFRKSSKMVISKFFLERSGSSEFTSTPLLVYPYLTYCNVVWTGTYATRLSKLVILQKKAVRVVAGIKKWEHAGSSFVELGLLRFGQIRELQI